MLRIYFTNKMKRDVKRMERRGKDIARLTSVLALLAARKEPLPERFKDHALSGDRIGFRECHIEPDWLLVYSVKESALILVATETGTHSDLFGK